MSWMFARERNILCLSLLASHFGQSGLVGFSGGVLTLWAWAPGFFYHFIRDKRRDLQIQMAVGLRGRGRTLLGPVLPSCSRSPNAGNLSPHFRQAHP